MAFNKTINLFIFDGDPNGRIMCELSNWNGRVYKISRNELSLFSEREDSRNTGVYFLFGNDIDVGDTIYIGEAEKVYDRLKQHLNDEQYWNECIVVVSKDNYLNKAHVKYMENKFYTLAKSSGRNVVVNANVPTQSSVSEYDIAVLDEFIVHTQLLVNTLGKKSFEPMVESSEKSINNTSLLFKILAARGANAQGVIVSDGFAVLKESVIASSTTPSMSQSLINFREKLIKQGVIDSNYCFTKDYVFTSPSLAAGIVMGRNANGKAEWKNITGKSINDIENEI